MKYNRLYQNINGSVPLTDYTMALSQYLADLKYEDLPAEVVERAKFILLQTIGVSLAAQGLDIAEKVDKIGVQANGGLGGSVTRWIKGGTLSPANAALIAGTLADALDWEDCSWTGHPAAGIIPVAVIAAEERHKSGKELVTAIVGAYEVYQRIANAAQPDPASRWKGWGLTSWQLFGTVLAAAKLYGFDAHKIDQAIGMAAEHSSIPACHAETTMSDFYHYEHGYRARDGILIAKAVEKGIHNQRGALDDDTPSGYLASITSAPSPEWLTKGLGEQFLILETLLKHWPANMWVQASVEAVSNIAKKHGITAQDVQEIIIDPAIERRMWVMEGGLTSITHAQFSIPYVVSAFLLDPVPGAHWYSEENRKSPEMLALMEKVKAGDSEASPWEGFQLFRRGECLRQSVTIRTKDGHTYTEYVDRHPGHPRNMFTRGEISERFRIQAAPVLSKETVEEALDVILNIEREEDVSLLGRFLAG